MEEEENRLLLIFYFKNYKIKAQNLKATGLTTAIHL